MKKEYADRLDSFGVGSTVAIKVKASGQDRFFHDFGKRRRVMTAWSLAGAKLFRVTKFNEELEKVLQILEKKKKAIELVEIMDTVTRQIDREIAFMNLASERKKKTSLISF